MGKRGLIGVIFTLVVAIVVIVIWTYDKDLATDTFKGLDILSNQ